MLIDFSKLVPAAQKGDEKAMEEICLAFRPLALNLGHKKRYAVLEERQCGESNFLRTIIQLWKKIFRLPPISFFRAILRKMCLFFALNNAGKKNNNGN